MIKFDFQFSAIFNFFFPFTSFNFDKLVPPSPLINVLKYVLNHFLSPFQSKKQSQKCKNVVFSLFCILVGRPIGEPLPPPLLATLLVTAGIFFAHGAVLTSKEMNPFSKSKNKLSQLLSEKSVRSKFMRVRSL